MPDMWRLGSSQAHRRLTPGRGHTSDLRWHPEWPDNMATGLLRHHPLHSFCYAFDDEPEKAKRNVLADGEEEPRHANLLLFLHLRPYALAAAAEFHAARFLEGMEFENELGRLYG